MSVWCVTHNRKTRVAQRSMVVQRQWSSYRLTAFWTRCFRLLFLYNRVHHPDILSSFDQKKRKEREMSNIGCVLYKNILPSKRNFRCLLLFTSCFHVPPTPDLIWWKETLGFALFPWFSILIEILFFYFFPIFYRRIATAAGWKTHSKNCSNWRLWSWPIDVNSVTILLDQNDSINQVRAAAHLS